MSTCKDCIHYDICINRIRYHADENEFTGKELTDMDKACKRFKDKSKLVELPCKVGDTVYSIKHNKVDEYHVTSIQICTRVSVVIRLVNKYFTFHDVFRKDFGKTVFATKEEAEKALKERNNNDPK